MSPSHAGFSEGPASLSSHLSPSTLGFMEDNFVPRPLVRLLCSRLFLSATALVGHFRSFEPVRSCLHWFPVSCGFQPCAFSHEGLMESGPWMLELARSFFLFSPWASLSWCCRRFGLGTWSNLRCLRLTVSVTLLKIITILIVVLIPSCTLCMPCALWWHSTLDSLFSTRIVRVLPHCNPEGVLTSQSCEVSS